jgi:hypothetical protein
VVKRGSFLLRTDPQVLDALKRWAGQELRSVNGQIEFVLRRALQDAGRLKPDPTHDDPSDDPSDDSNS